MDILRRTIWAGHQNRVVAVALAALTACGCGAARSRPANAPAPDALEVIPARWVDLPQAPFVAKVVHGKADLFNRTERSFDRLKFGCVVEEQGMTRVVSELFGIDVHDSVLTALDAEVGRTVARGDRWPRWLKKARGLVDRAGPTL